MGQPHCVLEIWGGVFNGRDVTGQRAIHRRHIDRSVRQRAGRLIDLLTLTVEAEAEPTRLEAVWVTAGQQESSVGANDFEGERCVWSPVAGDFDGQRAATDHARLHEQMVGCGALYLLTDHEWDSRIAARHEMIMAGAVGPAATGALDAEGVR